MPAFFSILLLVILLVNPIIGYRLQIVSDGEIIYDVPAKEEHIEVSFRHSVNKGLIREIYRLDIKNRQMALETGYFESYGAGMLDTVPSNVGFRQENNFLVLDFPLQYQDSFTYRAGPEAGHMLYYGKDVLPLYEMIAMKSFKISILPDYLL